MTNKMPPEKVPSKASENRRATKPIMEKRRRARINQCLSELKTLILDALNKDPSRHSKLEKADILEMTVRYLQNLQRQQMAAAISTDPSVLGKFRSGFNECAGEVTRYVDRIEGADLGIRQRLVSHLSHCVNSLNVAAATVATPPFPGINSPPASTSGPHNMPGNANANNNNNNNNVNNNNGSSTGGAGIAFPGMSPPLLSQLQSLNVQIPGCVKDDLRMSAAALNFLPAVQAAALAAVAGHHGPSTTAASDINNNNNPSTPGSNHGAASASPSAPRNAGQDGKFFGGLPLIPSRLPNGDLAFLLPSHALANGHLFDGSDRNDHRDGHLHWGPPTPTSPMDPTSPTLSRRSSSPTSTVDSALSPTGSEVSEDKCRKSDHRPLSSPQPSSSGLNSDGHQRRHPSVIVQAPPTSQNQRTEPQASSNEPVWRPW